MSTDDEHRCDIHDEQPVTRQERRASKKQNNEKMVVTNRSVGDLARLASRPKKGNKS